MIRIREPIPYTKIRELNIWTFSNFLSISRVLLLPFILQFLKEGENATALILMTVGVLTDVFDGVVARLSGTVSSFGKIIDPLADKICLGTILVYLNLTRDFPLWIVFIVLARDVFIVIGSSLLIRRRKVIFSSNVWGKLTVVVLAALVIAYAVEYSKAYLFLKVLFLLFFLGSIITYSILARSYLKSEHVNN